MTNRDNDSNKTRVLQLRVTEAELSALTALAANRGVSTSEYHRRILRETISCGVGLFPDDISELQQLRREVRRIGKNINQISKAINSGKVTFDQLVFESIAESSEITKSVAQTLAIMIDDARSRRVRLRKAASV